MHPGMTLSFLENELLTPVLKDPEGNAVEFRPVK
jgi:hypothetical protein